MKIGVSAFAWTAEFGASHLHLLPKVREHGLEGFEIPMFDPGPPLSPRFVGHSNRQTSSAPFAPHFLPASIPLVQTLR